MKQGHKLPIGIQDFRTLREEAYLYVDKTEFIHQLATEGMFYFLSRPRRFGKSLMVSTLKELFLGSKELFEGLWIENRWDWSRTNPVVHISFEGTNYNVKGLEKTLLDIVDHIALKHRIALSGSGYAWRFRELLELLSERNGKVVVLIDEYDKPIIDYLHDVKQADINREILKEFYVVLKGTQAYQRMVFITGISRFSKVSIFSALNHLDDISMDFNYGTICGYTQEELEQCFPASLESSARKLKRSLPELLSEMRHWYNGYSWDGETSVYNPFSILNFLGKQEFKAYWFSTGTPDFLAQLAKREQIYDLDNIETQYSAFESYDIGRLNLQALLFQTGYLTVKSYKPSKGRYVLGYPNLEVRSAFLEYLVSAYADMERDKIVPLSIRLEQAFLDNNLTDVMSVINTIFARIPNLIFDGKNEKYFHSLVHLIFSYFGTYIESEVNTNAGRIDSVILAPDHIYILEFKMNATAEEALKQIKDKNYAQKYRQLGKPITGVGINFSGDRKEISEWKEETL